MAKFMLIVLEPPGKGFQSFSPDVAQRLGEKAQAWAAQLRATGKHVGGEKLKEEGGKVVARQKDRIAVIDGPYAEVKEVVGGVMTILADSYDEALELARTCPLLEYARIAVREVDPMGCGGK
jgi:hypothetical protein